MKVLNLYAGLGGNRRLWKDAQVTAVEIDPEIAQIYKTLYPKDIVIIGDAHQYLLEHYKEFDFIWSSPPCQSHSSFRYNICVRFRGTKPCYPDMKLYEEIVFLQKHAMCHWVVENVKPYYQPLISVYTEIQRHLFWANFPITEIVVKEDNIRKAQIPDLQRLHRINLSAFKIKNKRQILRNCVNAELGNHIFTLARNALGLRRST